MNRIEFGDCRAIMRRWAQEGIKVQTCVTSPPYYGLRDYGHEGQIGLEETPEQYIEAMVEVFRCVWDVLADDGTLWLNIGDSYSGSGKGPAGNLGKVHNERDMTHTKSSSFVPNGCKPKDLIGIPWMLAFALRADGWYLRQDIIWHKPNPMPESVTDRCTKSHEYIFLLSKSQQYFYDNIAIQEPAIYAGDDRGARSDSRRGTEANSMSGKTGDFRNKRSVWSVTTKPYSGAHFAVFPEDLIEPCILAGTSQRGHCPKCKARWVRDLERIASTSTECPKTQAAHEARGGTGKLTGTVGKSGGGRINGFTKTLGWIPQCDCDVDPINDIILDPFMGSGTTAQVAQNLGRKYLGCELNSDYKPLQDQRLAQQSLELM